MAEITESGSTAAHSTLDNAFDFIGSFMKNCEICNGPNVRRQSIFCSVECSNKAYYNKNRQNMINRAAKWNRDNKNKRKNRNRYNGTSVYNGITQRCNNPNATVYKYYGAKGIRCLLTKNEFQEIYFNTNICSLCYCELCDDNRNTPNGRTIDRINVNGNYEKYNDRDA